jgi:hypothetical protein
MNTNEKRMNGKQHAKPDPATTYYYITLSFLIDLRVFAFIRGSKYFCFSSRLALRFFVVFLLLEHNSHETFHNFRVKVAST